MIEIQASFGSSSAGNAHLISKVSQSEEGSSAPLLLDCGLSLNKLKPLLWGAGCRLSHLAGCLVTHCHGDHAKAAADLMAAGVDVYMSLGTAKALGLTGHRLKAIEAGKQFQVGPWYVMPFEAVHDVDEPLNFLIMGGLEKLLYMTDTAYCPYRFIGLNLLMIECNYAADIMQANVDRGALPEAMKRRIMKTHMGLDAVKGFLKANDLSQVREIVLIHLSDGNSDAERFKREVEELTGKPTYVCSKGG